MKRALLASMLACSFVPYADAVELNDSQSPSKDENAVEKISIVQVDEKSAKDKAYPSSLGKKCINTVWNGEELLKEGKTIQVFKVCMLGRF